MRVHIIGNDGITLCRTAPAAVRSTVLVNEGSNKSFGIPGEEWRRYSKVSTQGGLPDDTVLALALGPDGLGRSRQ
jgi:hypothetical protein